MTNTQDWSSEDKNDLEDYNSTEGTNVDMSTPCEPEDYGFSSN